MGAILLIIVAIILFIIAYITYGKFVAQRLGIDPKRVTPAHSMKDGVDYVPAKSPVLLGHHFASIAGAGPIVGPIMAAVFGWVPVLLWIIIGGIFFGAVHDFASVVASVRHRGKSIGEVIEEYIGPAGKRLFLIFTWSTLILVMAVFTRLVAGTFVEHPAVASSSFLFMLVAVLFGFGIYRQKFPLGISSIIGILLLVLVIFIGLKVPFSAYQLFLDDAVKIELNQKIQSKELSDISRSSVVKKIIDSEIKAIENPGVSISEIENLKSLISGIEKAEASAFTFWVYILLIYVFIAATTPVWILLQPRDYLNSFLLYALLLFGVLGIFFAKPEINLPAIKFSSEIGILFPILFVTVACGAISGFHSLVSSGTTSKQLDRESDAKLIGYGGMLIESVLAIIALLAAGALLNDKFSEMYQANRFIPIFSEGVGSFIAKIPLLNISQNQASTFSALAVSAFALTSLDTCTRLARFAFQEFFETGRKDKKTRLISNRYVGTLISIAAAWVFIISGTASVIWPVFGSANQLLAALALLAVSVWLAKMKRKNLFTVIPMFFMFIITLTALITLMLKTINDANYILFGVACLLFIVAIILVVQGIRKLWGKIGINS